MPRRLYFLNNALAAMSFKFDLSLLGMNKIVSEDTARRSLLHVDEQAGNTCLEQHLKKSDGYCWS